MSTRRATCASVLHQQQQQNHLSPHTSVDDEGDDNPRAFHQLFKEVHDLKTQIDAMQVNIHFLAEQFKASKNNQHVSPRPSRPPSRHEHEHVDNEEDFERPHERQSPHQRRQRRHPPPKEVRIDLPPFHGKDNVETYLDWVAKIDQLFESHMIEQDRRVSLAALSFQGHALNC